MINIQPITKKIDQVAIRLSPFTLGNKPELVYIDLLVSGKVFDTIEWPLPDKVWQNWGENDNEFISFVLSQNGINLLL